MHGSFRCYIKEQKGVQSRINQQYSYYIKLFFISFMWKKELCICMIMIKIKIDADQKQPMSITSPPHLTIFHKLMKWKAKYTSKLKAKLYFLLPNAFCSQS